MRQKKLVNIRWRLTQFAILISLFVSLIAVAMVLLSFQLDIRVLIFTEWLHLPLLYWLLFCVVLIGMFSGYIYGNRIKKRLERIVESVMKFEQGDFAHRVPGLGDDEIGLIADHLNIMALRAKKQVASLQKLSAEKAEWQEKIKKLAVTEERQRLARELHDAVSQQLFAISMMSSAVLANKQAIDEKQVQQIAAIEKMAGDAQSEMRALLLHLRPARLENKGLKEGIAELLQEFQSKQSMEILWDGKEIPPLPKGIEDHMFRIVQEALSNVFRHSRATSVSVYLGTHNRQIHLKIIDNGIGFDMSENKATSYGLHSIQERASEIGGVAEIISFPNKGTQIDVKVPIVNHEGKDERKRET